jgi:hypothetical protein
MFMNHLSQFGDRGVPQSGMSVPFPSFKRAAESSIRDTELTFDLDDFDYATHDLQGEERLFVMTRNSAIIMSVVLTNRPDLADAICPKGKNLDEITDLYVRVLDRESRKLTEIGVARSEVYDQGARIVISYFDGNRN